MGLIERLRRRFFDEKITTEDLEYLAKMMGISPGGILTGQAIDEKIRSGEIHIDPYTKDNLNPNSYNLRTGNTVTVYNRITIIDLKDPHSYEDISVFKLTDDGFIMRPGNLYLVPTKEYIDAGNYVPIITGRSSVGRLGIEVHHEAGFGDTGFHGNFTLQMRTTYPLKIYPDLPLAQVYFITPVGEITGYRGKYQDSKGAVASKWVC